MAECVLCIPIEISLFVVAAVATAVAFWLQQIAHLYVFK
jgi:hypothetical protein